MKRREDTILHELVTCLGGIPLRCSVSLSQDRLPPDTECVGYGLLRVANWAADRVKVDGGWTRKSRQTEKEKVRGMHSKRATSKPRSLCAGTYAFLAMEDRRLQLITYWRKAFLSPE